MSTVYQLALMINTGVISEEESRGRILFIYYSRHQIELRHHVGFQKKVIILSRLPQVVSDTVGMVYQSVAGAKEAVVGAVMGGVELTRAAVSGGINTVMGTRMGQMVSSGMGLALSQSEDWVDQNLPLTERELGQ